MVDLAIRIALILAADAAVLIGWPTAVTAPLTLSAIVVVAYSLVSFRRRSGLDAVLVGFGGTLIVLILTGLLISLAGLRLSPAAWALTLTVPSLPLVVVAHQQRGTLRPVRVPTGLSVWLAIACAVTIGAIAVSYRATQQNTDIPLQMSLTDVRSGSAVVQLEADRGTAPLELQVGTWRAGRIAVPAIEAGSTLRLPIRFARTGRTVITLLNPGQSQPLRTLILNQ